MFTFTVCEFANTNNSKYEILEWHEFDMFKIGDKLEEEEEENKC